MTLTRPSFDEAVAFWRELLRERRLPDRLTWIFAEDARTPAGDSWRQLHARSSGAGEWLARRAYRSAPAGDTLTFAAFSGADGQTITGLLTGQRSAGASVQPDGWNLLFDTAQDDNDAHADRLFSATGLCEHMSDTEQSELRRTALQDLVLLTSPLATSLHALTELARDSSEVWTIEKQHVLSILSRFERNDIASNDVEAWANAIETRNDIDYDRESAVWDVLYELANPTLTEPLTRERADVLASVLKGH